MNLLALIDLRYLQLLVGRKNDAYVPGVYVMSIQKLTQPCMKAFTCKVWFVEFQNHGFIDIDLTCPETFKYIIIFFYHFKHGLLCQEYYNLKNNWILISLNSSITHAQEKS